MRKSTTAGARDLKRWAEAARRRDPKLTNAEIARRIGCAAATFSLYLSNATRPRYLLRVRIEKLTGGAVTVDSWEQPAALANATGLEAIQPAKAC